MGKQPNGSGSVYRRSDTSRWIASITYTDASGRTRTRTRTCLTRREAQSALRELHAAHEAGALDQAEPPALGAYLDGWLTNRAALRVRDNTLPTYRAKLAHVRTRLGNVRLDKLTSGQVQGLIAALTAAGLSPGYVRAVRVLLSAALGDAVRDGLLTRNPVAGTTPPRNPRRAAAVLSVDQAAHLLATAEAAGDVHAPLWTLLLQTGLRISEALGVRWSDLDLPGRRLALTVQLQRSRTRYCWELVPLKSDRPRTVPLTLPAVRALERRRVTQLEERLAAPAWGDTWGLVFTTAEGQPWHHAVVVYAFRRALTRAGLPPMRLHDLRHTVATLLLRQGVPMRVVSEILGHATMAVTSDIYSHVDAPLMSDALDRLAARMGAGEG